MYLCLDTYFNKEIKIIMIMILLLIIMFISCKDETSIKHNNNDDIKKIGITLQDKTTMRVDPFINSSVITYINKGEIVTVISKSPEKEIIGKNSYHWYYVSFSGHYIGWVYGNNLKIFPLDNKYEIRSYLSDLWGKELIAFRKNISGKWYPSGKDKNITEQSLEIFDDGKYKSHQAGVKIIEGEYSINFKEKEINFSNGTFFGNRISFFSNSSKYILGKVNRDGEIKLKKMSPMKK